jgi:hypothetical protein
LQVADGGGDGLGAGLVDAAGEEDVEEGGGGQGAGDDADAVACWRGLAPSMYPGLMSMRRLEALETTSAVRLAVARLVVMLPGATPP